MKHKLLLGILALSLLALLFMCRPDNRTKEEKILADMDLRQKAAQMLMPGFCYERYADTSDYEPLLGMNGKLEKLLSEYGFGGVLLYASNMKTPDQTRKLIDSLQEVMKKNDHVPLLIACDQEGGNIAKINYATRMPGNMALGAINDPETVKECASVIATEMKQLGLNGDLAPVADINNDPDNPIIGVRSFSDDPELVSSLASAYVAGLHEQDLIACAKHFPGHGDTSVDSHSSLPLIDKDLEELEAFELQPFKAAIAAGTDMIMSAHIAFPNIEKTTFQSLSGESIHIPATLSKTMIDGLLRDKLGYQGVIISDALDMDAIEKNFRPRDVATMAINAGIDILLVPVNDMKAVDSYYRQLGLYADMIVSLVEQGEIKEQTIDEAVLRILKMKNERGLLDDSQETPDLSLVGNEKHRDLELTIARQAVTFTKGKDLLPLTGKSIMVMSDDETKLTAATDILSEKMQDVTVTGYLYEDGSLEKADKQIPRLLKDIDGLVVITSTYSRSDLDSAACTFIQKCLDHAAKHHITSVIISSHLPYDLNRFDADIMLACYGSRVNLKAALLELCEPSLSKGTLPVKID